MTSCPSINGTDPSLLSLNGGLAPRTVSNRNRASFFFLLERYNVKHKVCGSGAHLTLLRTVPPELSGTLISSRLMKIEKD